MDELVSRYSRRLPSRGRSFAVGFGLLAALVLSASGVTSSFLFSSQTPFKWILTIGGPLLVVGLFVVSEPTILLMIVTIVMSPFAPYVVTFGGVKVSLLFALLSLTVISSLLEGTVRQVRKSKSKVARIAPWCTALLVVPVLQGNEHSYRFLYLLLFITVIWLVRRTQELNSEARTYICLAVVGLGLTQSLVGIWEFVTNSTLNLYGAAGRPVFAGNGFFFLYQKAARTSGAYFDPISLGNVLAIAIPIALYLFADKSLTRVWRTFCISSSLIMMIAIVITLSRAAWLGLAAALLVTTFLTKRQTRFVPITIAGVLLAIVGIYAFEKYGIVVKERFATIFNPTSISATTRAGDILRENQWAVSWNAFLQHPISGVGFGNIQALLQNIPKSGPFVHPTSIYLEYLSEAGVMGGIMLLLFVGSQVLDLLKGRMKDVLFPVLAGVTVGMLVTWYTDMTARYYAVAFVVAILAGLNSTSAEVPSPNSPKAIGSNSDLIAT